MRLFANSGLAAKVMAGLGSIIVVVGTVGYLSYDGLTQLSATTAINNHTYQVLDATTSARESMVNRETGLRGFLISGDEASLAPYRSGSENFSRELARAKSLTADNPGQQQRLAAVETAASEWTRDVAERAIALARDPAKRAEGLAIEARGEGRRSFDAFRAAIEAVVTEEQKLLVARSAAYQQVVSQSRTVTLVGVAITLALALGFGLFMNGAITRPVVQMTAAMRRLADNDLATEVPHAGRGDEIGAMAKAVQVFKDNAIAVKRMEEQVKAASLAADADKKAAMSKMADAFQASVGGVVSQVAQAATDMQRSAQALSATAEQTKRQASAVSASTEEASANVQTVAASSEELAASIGEISRQVTNSSTIANRAVEQARATDTKVQGLSEAAGQIGDVVRLIADIASRTNLLALNATIEAARAGDAGKGFAVVASEVKTLATQTAKATEEIGGKVAEMQAATSQSVEAIRAIGHVIAEMSGIAAGIASAVEQQGAATQEIARNVQEAARGTQDVSANIGGVTQASGATGEAAGQMLGAATGLSQQAETLRREVDGFLATVRAA